MNRYLLPILLFSGTVYFAILYVIGPQPRTRGVPLPQPARKTGSVPYSKIQQMKQETAIKVGIRKQQADMRKRIRRPELDPSYKLKKKFHKTEHHEGFHPVGQDMEDGSIEEAVTLDQRMDDFLAERQRFEMLEASKRKLYVKRFIMEARKMGFKVKVSENLEVVDVQKIKEH